MGTIALCPPARRPYARWPTRESRPKPWCLMRNERGPSGTIKRALGAGAVGVLLALAPAVEHGPALGSEATALRGVWQRVRAAGGYRFSADVVQRAEADGPGGARPERLYLEGAADLVGESFQLRLWRGGGSAAAPETALQLEVDGDQARARQGLGPWQPMGDAGEAFAPGGDFLAYLAAARDVRRHAEEARTTPLGTRAFTRYTFQVDGPRYARFMRQRLTERLARRGELPPGATAALPEAYAGMRGTGELWVGTDGLPIRQVLDLRLPDPATGQAVRIASTVDFSGFGSETAAASAGGGAPWLVAALERLLGSLAGAALLLVLAVGVVRHSGSGRLYAAVALAVSTALLAQPLVQTRRLQAATAAGAERYQAQAARDDASEAQRALGARLDAPRIDPHADPIAGAAAQSAALAALAAGGSGTADPHLPAVCTSDPTGDPDADGLTNQAECLLGTDPGAADSDQDGLDDGVEVQGFAMGSGPRWYGDPRLPDSNHDGLGDGQEWQLDANDDQRPDDTDGDGTPDVWDRDNDGDGVPDALDLSPFTGGGGRTFDGADPLGLVLDDLTAGDMVTVQFQLKPTDPDHLWFAGRVLDWPDNDPVGHIQDVDGKSFHDLDPTLAPMPNDLGDVRTVPMLEITIAGSLDNVPPASTLSDYGIALKQTSSSTWAAYVPLNVIADPVGDANVAFHGRMVYSAAAAWGAAHQVRLVWAVQALVDDCDRASGASGSTTAYHCSDASTYDDLRILHVYEDSWSLTGVHVKEEKAANLAIVYEDPTAPGTHGPLYLDHLYQLAADLDNAFVGGRDCDTLDANGACTGGNGHRDITIPEIHRRFNRSTNGSVSADQRWGLDNVFAVDAQSNYATLEAAIRDATTRRSQAVLETAFSPLAVQGSSPITPTLLYAYGTSYRGVNQDDGLTGTSRVRWDARTLTIDLVASGAGAVPLVATAGLQWAPFAYTSADGWYGADIAQFYRTLGALLAADIDAGDPALDAGYLWLAEQTYLALVGGVALTVAVNGHPVGRDYQVSDKTLATMLTGSAIKGILGTVKMLYANQDAIRTVGEELAESGNASTLDAVSVWAVQKVIRTFSGGGLETTAAWIVLVAAVIAATSYAIMETMHLSAGEMIAAKAVTGTGVAVALSILQIAKPIKQLASLVAAGDVGSWSDALFESSEILGQSRVLGVIGLILTIGLAIGILVWAVTSGHVRPGSIQFNYLVAQTFGVIAVAVLYFILSLTVVGLLIVVLISIIDLVLLAIGVHWSISGALADALAKGLYQYDLQVDDPPDIDVGALGIALADPDEGLIQGNPIVFSLPITTTLARNDKYYSSGDLLDNALAYRLAGGALDPKAFAAPTGSRRADWHFTDADDAVWTTDHVAYTATYPAGINQQWLDATGQLQQPHLTLNGAYGLVSESCWTNTTGIDMLSHPTKHCKAIAVTGNSSQQLPPIPLDILPATFDAFAKPWEGSWAYNAGKRLVAPDRDGDGLLTGADPDDTRWDADGDGLSDAYELERGHLTAADGGYALDATKADTDGDGLPDGEELRQGADPTRPDGDGDGLPDAAEIRPSELQNAGGWLMAYAPGKLTRVWSDPLAVDSDGDGLTDPFEQSNASNPTAWTTNPVPLVVTDSSTAGVVATTDTLYVTATVANQLPIPVAIDGALALAPAGPIAGGPLAADIEVLWGRSEALVGAFEPSGPGAATITATLALTEVTTPLWTWTAPASVTRTTPAASLLEVAVTPGTATSRYQGAVIARDASGAARAALTDIAGGPGQFNWMTADTSLEHRNIAVACQWGGKCMATWIGHDPGSLKDSVQACEVGFGSCSRLRTIASGLSYAEGGAIAADTTHLGDILFPMPQLVAWTAGSGTTLQARRVLMNYNQDFRGDAVTLAQGVNIHEPATVFAGDRYLVGWLQGLDSALYYRFVDLVDGVSPTVRVADVTGAVKPAFAYDVASRQGFVAYSDGSHFLGRRLSAAGASEAITLGTGQPAAIEAAALPQLGGWVVSWVAVGDAGHTHVQAVGPDGALRGSQLTVASAGLSSYGLGLSCKNADCSLPRATGAPTLTLSSAALARLANVLPGADAQTATRAFTLDGDAPSGAMVLSGTRHVRRGDPVAIGGSATDATSFVRRVEVQVGSAAAWQAAKGAATWSYDWPATGIPDGAYAVSARATDAVGHVAALAGGATLVVDGAAPDVDVVLASGGVRPLQDTGGRWQVPLTGSATDPPAGTQAGSGVVALEVLLSGSGALSASRWQTATVATDGTWSLDYLLMPAPKDEPQGPPSGTVHVLVRASDAVGNATPPGAYDHGPLTIDARGPDIALAQPGDGTLAITSTLSISGTASDATGVAEVAVNLSTGDQVDALRGAALHLPFDERHAAQAFADVSGWNRLAACDSDRCPEANVDGQRDRAVRFDGSGQPIAMPSIDLAGRSFTLAAWAKRATTATQEAILTQSAQGAVDGLYFGFGDGGAYPHLLFCGGLNGAKVGVEPEIPDDRWHHWACRYDAAAKELLIFYDGVPVGSPQAYQVDPGSAGAFTVGALPDGHTAPFAGALDELMVYDRALAPAEVDSLYGYGRQPWRIAALDTAASPPRWRYDLPQGADGLEGYFQLEVRGRDPLGNTTEPAGRPTWRGVVDTRSPAVTYTVAADVRTGLTTYGCSVRDFSLVEETSCLPTGGATVPAFRSTDLATTLYTAVSPWYAAVFSDTSRLYGLFGSRAYPSGTEGAAALQACDAFGRCTTATAVPGAVALASADDAPERPARALAQPTSRLEAGLIDPSAGTVLTAHAPVALSGYALADDGLARLEVAVDGTPAPLHTASWPPDPRTTDARWSAEWTPAADGAYGIRAVVVDAAGRSSAAAPPERVYVDTAPPTVTIQTPVLTATHRAGLSALRLAGTATDAAGVHRVDVRVEDGPWHRAAMDGQRWSLSWQPPSGAGGSVRVAVRATDVAGRTAEAERSVSLDDAPPAPGEMTLAVRRAGDQEAGIQPGQTARDGQALVLRWEAAAGEGGAVAYFAGFSQDADPRGAVLTRFGGAGSHEQPLGDAETWYAHLRVVDAAGNAAARTLGPVYVDRPETPDLVQDLGYAAWADGACALQAVDRRAARRAPGAAPSDDQRLYASWDERAFRLRWRGADWDHDGDLFVYLDTRPGGARQLMDPYGSGPAIYFPGNAPQPADGLALQDDGTIQSVDAPAMRPDVLVWVEHAGRATRWRWDGNGWRADAQPLGDAAVRTVRRAGATDTDLLLAFADLGLADPAAAPIGLLAVASQEGALRLWATMPDRNPLNGPLGAPARAGTATADFGLAHGFFWPALGAGACPNGRLTPGSGPTGGPFQDSDITVRLSSQPVGTIVGFLGDGLLDLWRMLLGTGGAPLGRADALTALDADHRPLGQDQTVAYGFALRNHGSEAATGVVLRLDGWLALGLPGGQPLPSGLGDRQQVAVGTIAPGATQHVTVTGRVDWQGLGAARQARCLESHDAATCRPNLERAALDADLFDDRTPPAGGGAPWPAAPIEWLFAEHAVDSEPPHDVAITAPSGAVRSAPTTVRGTAHDASGVVAVELEVARDGVVRRIACPDDAPEDDRWSCAWTPEGPAGSAPFVLRARATDGFGQTGAWSPPHAVRLDSRPPVVSVAPGVAGRVFGRGQHALEGAIVDDLGVGQVRVCVDDFCRAAVVHPSGPGATRGTWSAPLPEPRVAGLPDGEAVTALLYGIDAAGNASVAPLRLTYRVDVRAPTLVVGQVVEAPQAGTPLVSGTVADGSPVAVYVHLNARSGASARHRARSDGDGGGAGGVGGGEGGWSFTPASVPPDVDHLWVEAVDAAGNRTLAGPFAVQPPVGARVYVPVVEAGG